MRIAVRYQSWSGNTRKVAEAIARKSGVVAKPLDPAEKFPPGIDLLFVGGGVYADNPSKKVTGMLSELTAEQVSCLAFFYTAVRAKAKAPDKLRSAVKDSSISIVDDAFHCFGKFLLFKRDQPDSNDLAQAESFAKRTIEARRKALKALK